MFRASYTQQGLEGVIQEGFAARQAAVTALIEGAGGSVEAFYFAYGDDDVVGVLDGSEQTAIALSLAGEPHRCGEALDHAAPHGRADGRRPDTAPGLSRARLLETLADALRGRAS